MHSITVATLTATRVAAITAVVVTTANGMLSITRPAIMRRGRRRATRRAAAMIGPGAAAIAVISEAEVAAGAASGDQ